MENAKGITFNPTGVQTVICGLGVIDAGCDFERNAFLDRSLRFDFLGAVGEGECGCANQSH